MTFKLPELPYQKTDFQGVLSAESFDYHYNKHHQSYVSNLNTLIKGTQHENAQLIDIIKRYRILQSSTNGKIYNNAAQHFNHSFFWHSITPLETQPTGVLLDAIIKKWGTLKNLLDELSNHAINNFGSGWTWLALNKKQLLILNTSNAETILHTDFKPLLVIDVWQHAYYIDYRNMRGKYVENLCKLLNWKFAELNFINERSRL